MKTSTLFQFLLFCVLIQFLSSCKKNSVSPQKVSTNTTELNPVVNPIIARTISDYNSFTDTVLTGNGWTKTFEDNFDGDLSKWGIWHGGGFKKELQCYQPSNLQIVNGVLQITAKKETVTGPTGLANDTLKTFDFTSGGIISKSVISANATTPRVRIVARMKFAKGYGMASSFWSYGDNWPQQGEIDYAELRGDDPTKYFNDYFYGSTINKNVVTGAFEVNRTDADLSATYHVYEMEWTQNTLISYIDGQLIETKTAGVHIPDLFGKSEHIALNLAVGGLLYSSLTPENIQMGTLYVDYVKVFTSNK
jgi:beta-glucanase (GH16 family)